MFDRTLRRLHATLLRQPGDPAAWSELEELLRRGIGAGDLAELAPALTALDVACAASPGDRTLPARLLPMLGWDLVTASERAPGAFWVRHGRLGRYEGDPQGLGAVDHLYDTVTGMPLHVRSVPLGMTLAWVPPGDFLMGLPPELEGRPTSPQFSTPARPFRFDRGFYMGIHEVTQGEYRGVIGEVPEPRQGREQPIGSVSWYDAMSFCRRLTELTRRDHPLAGALAYRLPCEVEWEYACRADEVAEDPVVDPEGPLRRRAWFASPVENAMDTRRVGSLEPNAFGLHDMLGNVAEWCLDEFQVRLDRIHPEAGEHRDEDDSRHAVVHDGRDYEFFVDHWHQRCEDGTSRYSRMQALAPGLFTQLSMAFRRDLRDRSVRGGSYLDAGTCVTTGRSYQGAGLAYPWIGFRVLATLW